MTEFLDNVGFALTVTGPIMFILALGWFLARVGIITDAFIDAGSKLVFNVTLPALLFVTIGKTDFAQTANLLLVGVGLGGTLLVYLLAEVLATKTVEPRVERGVVVQGIYRSNMGIVGLAYCVNAYGDLAMAVGALYLGLVTIQYNILAVITLNRSLNGHRSLVPMLKGIVRNPLIIGITAALPVSYFHWDLPGVVQQAGDYFAQMTLPLALLCTGGSLNLAALRLDSRNAAIAVAGKLVASPLLMTAVGYAAGLRGMELGIVFLMSAGPTAAASYVMSRAMGGNATLAANIIVMGTVGSVLVTSLGVTLLRSAGLM